MGNDINSSYKIAREKYARYQVDTDEAIKTLKNISFSIHGWQADDFSGFEKPESELSGGGLLSTGNFPGVARNLEEYRKDIEKVISLPMEILGASLSNVMKSCPNILQAG